MKTGRPFRVQEAISYVDGAVVKATSKDGWLHIVVEARDEIIGYAVTVNGKDLPYTPASNQESSRDA